MAAQPAPTSPTGAPVRTLAALARIPTPTTASEVAHLYSSIRHVEEELAMIVDNHGVLLRKELGSVDGTFMDKAKARRAARQATLPIHQSAERCRGAAASMRAAWVRFTKIYATLIKPRAKRKAFQFDK
jgi:hypothetical protein